MKYFNEDSGLFSGADEPDEDYYDMAENAEYTQMPLFSYATPTYTWKELEGAWQKLGLTPGDRHTSEATPDDWLETWEWVKNLKEKI